MSIKRVYKKVRLNNNRISNRKITNITNIKKGLKTVEVVMTKQGKQVIDSKACAKAVTKLDTLLKSSYNSKEECEKAEQSFREYLLKKGYTRF